MPIVNAEVAIEGTRPLLWHHFGTDAIPLEREAKKGVAGHNPQEWEKTVLKLPNGQLYLEPAYIFGAIRDGARHTRLGRGSLQPKLTSTLQVRDDKILIDRWVPKGLQLLIMAEDQPVYLDVRSVRNPATRGRNIRYRVAASPGWKTTFTIYWENTIVHENQMRSIVKDAGAFQGLGDGRTIGFGRFEITSFELTESERAKKPAAKRSVARPKA